jgi:hypothetical protein
VLLFAGPGTIAGRVLGWRPLVGIGLISYSAYLWHQPLFAFARLRMIDHPPDLVMVMLALLSLGLAVVTWALVEQPFRRRGAGLLRRRAGAFLASAVGMAAFVTIGFGLDRAQGVPLRLADNPAFGKVQALASQNLFRMTECHLDGTLGTYPGLARPECNTGGDAPLDAVIIGDSHASALRLALFETASDLNIGTIAYGSCPPVPGIRSDRGTDCPMLTERLYADLAASDVRVVILAARWSLYSTGTGFDNGAGGREEKKLPYWNDAHSGPREAGVIAAYAEGVARLQAAGKRVVLVHPVPEAGWHVGNRLVRAVEYGHMKLQDAAFGADPTRVTARHVPVTALFNSMSEVLHVRPEAALCDTLLAGLCAHVAKGELLYDDDDHLSADGARLIVPLIIAAVRQALTTR